MSKEYYNWFISLSKDIICCWLRVHKINELKIVNMELCLSFPINPSSEFRCGDPISQLLSYTGYQGTFVGWHIIYISQGLKIDLGNISSVNMGESWDGKLKILNINTIRQDYKAL